MTYQQLLINYKFSQLSLTNTPYTAHCHIRSLPYLNILKLTIIRLIRPYNILNSNIMLSPSLQQQLGQFGIAATQVDQFTSGLKLMQLVNQVFHQGQNTSLSNKLKLTDQQKTGNNVLNINMILNHLKKDSSIPADEQIRSLNTFTVLQDQQAMLQLIQWILAHQPNRAQTSTNCQGMSPPRQQENEFDNLYFVSSLQKKRVQLDDSLEQQNPQEKVVRKGSFKVLKPKVKTASKVPSEASQPHDSYLTDQKDQSKHKEPLRQIMMVEPNHSLENEERDDLNCRKTIPKMYERPPLYKQKQKELRSIRKEPTPEPTIRINREEVMRNIQTLDHQILQEQKSLSFHQEAFSSQKPQKKSSRKIFKREIPETDSKRKKVLLEWLISINLLGTNAIKFIDQLHTICKDGVVFVEVVNYYKGRGKQLCYFKEPKRSAEMHSNYQKLFSFLSELIDFKSDLLNEFEYFIPEAQPNAFWQFLNSLYQCYNKRIPPTRQTHINRYENSISRQLDRSLSKQKNTSESTSYKEIKYNSSSVKKEQRSNRSSVQLPRKQTPTPSRAPSRNSQQHTDKSIAPYGLIQNQEPVEEFYSNSRTERGYKDLYLCKFKNVETPHKNNSFSNISLSRSRTKTHNSSKKKDHKPVVPSINLEMQMKVMKYLEDINVEEDVQELFKDPYRNGTLLCLVVKKYLGIDCLSSRRPKSIEDCRSNIYTAMEMIRTHKESYNSAYESYTQEILKGQRSLLYGLIWELIRQEDKENNRINTSLSHYCRKPTDQDVGVSWIRSVQRNYPPIGNFKIRNEVSLLTAITSTDFLFHYSWFITGKKAITPTYERPVNDIQKESNLKKALGYLVQSKIIRSDYLWKAKLLLKNENNLLRDLVNDLINHYSNLYKKEQIRTVNFVKYVKREDSSSKEKYGQKLETTMANQTIAPPQPPPPQPILEVTWMRKLGFTGKLDLNDGVILCRLISKLTDKTIQGFRERPQSKAQCLGNIRRALKLITKCRWDEYDIFESDHTKALQVYAFLKDRYKHSYAMKGI